MLSGTVLIASCESSHSTFITIWQRGTIIFILRMRKLRHMLSNVLRKFEESWLNWYPNTILDLEPKPSPLCMLSYLSTLSHKKDTHCHCVAKCLYIFTSWLNFLLLHKLYCRFQWIPLEFYSLCPHLSYPGKLLMEDIWSCPFFNEKKKVISSYNLLREALNWSP